MVKKTFALVSLATLAVSAVAVSAVQAKAETATGYNLRLNVPVNCNVGFRASGASFTSDTVQLGELREYCNAPNGYRLVIRYTPGTLRGVAIAAGADRVVLDGSGMAHLPGAQGPRKRTRPLSASLGPSGFDAQAFQIDAEAN